MVYRLIVAYRGTDYVGWQRQPNGLAVQEVLESALADLVGERVGVVASGRTDAGVHARGQSVHLEINREFPLRGLVFGLNHRLPTDIRVMNAYPMKEGFHARFEARSKVYRYRLSHADVISPLDGLFVVPAPRGLDSSLCHEAAQALVGRHDFSAFALAGGAHTTSERRILEARWQASEASVDFVVEGEGFLRGMVRSLVGTLLEVGTDRRSLGNFRSLLEGMPRSEAGPTAPARGLILETVRYGEEWSLGPGLW